MTVKLSGIRASARPLGAVRRIAQRLPGLRRRDGSVAASCEPTDETSLRTAIAARGWTFLLCDVCGHVADWVTGVSHACAAVQDTGRREGVDASTGDGCRVLFDEIDEYLTSRDGRYDALVAALIIRTR